MKRGVFIIFFLFATTSGLTIPDAGRAMGGNMASFTIQSTAFKEGETIPRVHTCEGRDTSPELFWSEPPEGTKSYVLIVDDPDAPVGVFTHWVLYDLPADARKLDGGMPTDAVLANGAKQGYNDFGTTGYRGPCPPRGHGKHRYFFRLMALDVETLGLSGGASRSEVERALNGHVLGKAVTMGRYERR